MLYIHELKDLNLKTAEIEVTKLVRDIKKREKQPLTNQNLNNHISEFFISKTDMETMSKSLSLIPDTINAIVKLSKAGGPYEPVNLKRACAALEEMPIPLSNNITYGQEIAEYQEVMIQDLVALLNQIPKLKTDADKRAHDKSMSPVFEKILRGKTFHFNASDIINEAHIERMTFLAESVDKGFFFHVKLEEHLKKEDPRFKEVPSGERQVFDTIGKNISLIKAGIDRAYEHNMRMLNLAVILYAYVRWLSAK